MRDVFRGQTLVLLTCGWVLTYPESRRALKQSIHTYVFTLHLLVPFMTHTFRLELQHAVAFTAVRFQGVLASFFLNALFFSHFIEGFGLREAFPKALSNGFDFGSHSDVVLFESPLPSPSLPVNTPSFSATKFAWWNTHHRPYGFTLPLVCPVCHAVRPWKEATMLPDGWVASCENPSCGLREDGSRENPAAKLFGKKPDGIEFVTPVKKRPSGWFAVDISSEFL